MRSTRIAVLAAAIALGAPASASGQPKPVEAASDRADILFREGNEAYDRGDFEEAAARYAAAFALKQTHDIAANLGAAEMKLNRHAAAANHLAYALASFPPSGEAKKRDGLKARFEEARAQSLAVTITAEAGAEILVDGAPIGVAPLDGAHFVAPGEHAIEARLGDRSGRSTARGGAGETASAEVVLAAGAAPAPTGVVTPPSTPPVEDADEGLPLWPAFVGGGVAVVAAAAGVGFLVASGAAGDDAASLREALGNTSCDGSTDSRCAELADAASSESTLGGAGVGFLVAGGVVAIGSIVYGLVAGSSGAPSARDAHLQLAPAVDATLGGAVMRGTF